MYEHMVFKDMRQKYIITYTVQCTFVRNVNTTYIF